MSVSQGCPQRGVPLYILYIYIYIWSVAKHSEGRTRSRTLHIKGRVTFKKNLFFSYLDFIGRACQFFSEFLAVVLWVKNAVQNGLLPLPLFVFRLQSIWDGLHVTTSKVQLQSLHTLCMVRGFPVVASYVAWRADEVLYGSYTSIMTATTLVRVYLCKIAFLAVKQDTVDLLRISALLEC